MEPSADERARYDSLRKELAAALPKKRAVDKQLAQIEAQIHAMEGQYLTETAVHSGGNIIQGFEGYLKNQTGGRRKPDVGDQDRVFSNSSLTFLKSLELLGDDESVADDYNKHATPGLLVVVPSAAQIKKQRDRDYQRKKRANRGSVGTISDEDIASTTSSSRRPSKRARMTDDD